MPEMVREKKRLSTPVRHQKIQNRHDSGILQEPKARAPGRILGGAAFQRCVKAAYLHNMSFRPEPDPERSRRGGRSGEPALSLPKGTCCLRPHDGPCRADALVRCL
jgi:hypothetical protein